MFKEIRIKANNVKSLFWRGDELVDLVSGGYVYRLSGECVAAYVNYAYSFDAAIASPSGEYEVIYTRNQTKGLLLKKGEILREINRSFYRANAYEYPVTFAQLKSGKEVLIHCPTDYCRLDIEDVETGRCLSDTVAREPADVFHSRLSVSPQGKWLMSAGWVWHPIDVVVLFDLEAALADPRSLDKMEILPPGGWEESCAAFLNDDYVVLASSDYVTDDEDEENEQTNAYKLALWKIGEDDYQYEISCDKPLGTLFPLTTQYVVSFYQHPRLWDLVNGKLIHEWKDIAPGHQSSSIIWDYVPPPIALDAKNKRFAVANEEEIVVVSFDKSMSDSDKS